MWPGNRGIFSSAYYRCPVKRIGILIWVIAISGLAILGVDSQRRELGVEAQFDFLRTYGRLDSTSGFVSVTIIVSKINKTLFCYEFNKVSFYHDCKKSQFQPGYGKLNWHRKEESKQCCGIGYTTFQATHYGKGVGGTVFISYWWLVSALTLVFLVKVVRSRLRDSSGGRFAVVSRDPNGGTGVPNTIDQSTTDPPLTTDH